MKTSPNAALRASQLSLIVALSLSATAGAVVVSERVFIENGGNLDDVRSTITEANAALREQSLSAPFHAVGWIGNCTATWLGNEGDWSYILTAAHCTQLDNGGSPDTESAPTDRTFTDYSGKVIADGPGTVFLHEFRVEKPEGHGGASTDIAILKLPRVADILSPEGEAVPQPVLYDGDHELGFVVELCGYGLWGAGDQTLNGFSPSEGPRRMWGRSRISRIFEEDHGIGALYVPNDAEEEGNDEWARVASGDSGSAWWQDHEGMKVIIATTNGGHATLSTGARVSRYVAWVRSIFPAAQLFSEVIYQRDALVSISEEAPGPNCEEGGSRVEVGLDVDASGALDPDEVDTVEFVCDEPPIALSAARDEAPGENCPEGGVAVSAGFDEDNDGELGELEVQTVDYVCDDPAPAAGQTDQGCAVGSGAPSAPPALPVLLLLMGALGLRPRGEQR